MSLPIGARVGPYEIIAALGAGGMGEVYRARDPKLNRDVAITFLPRAVATDPDRIARFEREAKTLAALNHPNIAHIHGLEESDGVRGIVMELVDGSTLADRIAQGPIPLEETLPIPKQIADALEAAHEQGIVHRDLKPANIKVRSDGVVKVLDFGLAKALDATTATPGNATVSPTITTPALMTSAGVILGTAAYMSPEQAKGRPAEKRSDLWAFGCVLYEMLSGRRAFEGEDLSETIANVLRSEARWDALPDDTPPSLRRLVRRCLERDLRQRLRDIGDAQLELRDAGIPSDQGRRDVAATARMWRHERVAWAVAVGLCAALVGFAGRACRPSPAARETYVDINTPPTNDVASFALSPDGRAIAFVVADRGQPQLWVRSLDSSSARPLAGTEGARLPFWSPDGHSLGFFAETRLKRVDLDTGATQSLATVVTPGGGTWNREGTILYVPNTGNGPVMRVASGGGEPATIAQLHADDVGLKFPSFLPDGRRFLLYVAGGATPRGVYLGEVGSSSRKRLLTADAPARYTAGHLLFQRDAALFVQPFDPAKGELSGAAIHVADSIAINSGGIDALSVSPEGTIAFRTGRPESGRALVWFDRSGKQIGDPLGRSLPPVRVGSVLLNPSLSPDGRRVAVQHGGDIWIIELDRDVATRFTTDPGIEALPLWSPNGDRIVFDSPRKGPADLFMKRLDGSIAEELLLSTPEPKFPADWTRDGRLILFKSVDAKTGSYDLWALSLDDPSKPFPIVRSDFDERDGQFSPDGQWLAYESNESGRPEVYVQPFPAGEKVRISTAGGTQVRWRSDGRELFYVALDNQLMSVRFAGSNRRASVETPAALFATHILPSAGIVRQQYVVSPDGQRFLINTVTREESLSPITLVLNWHGK